MKKQARWRHDFISRRGRFQRDPNWKGSRSHFGPSHPTPGHWIQPLKPALTPRDSVCRARRALVLIFFVATMNGTHTRSRGMLTPCMVRRDGRIGHPHVNPRRHTSHHVGLSDSSAHTTPRTPQASPVDRPVAAWRPLPRSAQRGLTQCQRPLNTYSLTGPIAPANCGKDWATP